MADPLFDERCEELFAKQEPPFNKEEKAAFERLYDMAITPPKALRMAEEGLPADFVTHEQGERGKQLANAYLFLPMDESTIQEYQMSREPNVKVLLDNMEAGDRERMMNEEGRSAIIKQMQTKRDTGMLKGVAGHDSSEAQAVSGTDDPKPGFVLRLAGEDKGTGRGTPGS